jgi:hypothetical protein
MIPVEDLRAPNMLAARAGAREGPIWSGGPAHGRNSMDVFPGEVERATVIGA